MSTASADTFRIREAAELLGVSDDTVRRWIDQKSLPAHRDSADRWIVDGADLATFSRERAQAPDDGLGIGSSARNKFVGLVTHVKSDEVMSEVELQCGPFAVVSLMSTTSVRNLGLVPGRRAVAVVKATTVIVDTPPAS